MAIKILVVDDSPIVLESTAITLEEAGYEVVCLENPLSVAHVLRKEQPALALVDVDMPALSGDTAVGILARNGGTAAARIVLHSAKAEADLQERCLRCGAHGFIRKTADVGLLVQQVAEQLSRNPQTLARAS